MIYIYIYYILNQLYLHIKSIHLFTKMSIPTKPKSFTMNDCEINITSFLNGINSALSSIDIIEDNDGYSVGNTTFNDEKYYKINSHVYLVSSISTENKIESDTESTALYFPKKCSKNKLFEPAY